MSLAARLGVDAALARDAIGIGAGAWGVIALVTTGQLFVQAQLADIGAGFWHILLWMACAWSPWVPAALVIAALVQRLRNASRAVLLLAHAVSAVLLGLLHVVLFAALSPVLAPPWVGGQRAEFRQELGVMVLSYFYSELVLYGALAAGITALRSRRELRQRELVESRLARELADAQLQALRSQVRPHFLFNALNTVAMMVRTGERGAAIGMIAALSDLLRWSLRTELAQEVALAEELTGVDRYLEVERWRLGERLIVDRRVPPELLGSLVPPFLLQPLVENAIRHGVSRRPGPGRVEIAASASDGVLELSVGDDGPGLAGGAAGEGIGLRTVRGRLAGLYGVVASLDLRPHPGGGVVATVRLPLRIAARAAPSVAAPRAPGSEVPA